MKEEINFLKNLQKELKEQDKDSKASPRYWSIMDYIWTVTDEGYHDRASIYFYDNGESTTVEHYVETKCNNLNGKYSAQQIEELKERYEWGTEEEILDWIHENDTKDCHLIYEKETCFIVPNTMFLTKKEAKDHLELNYYHYSPKAHTYAMTSWRAPKVEKILTILETLDWDFIQNNIPTERG